MSGFYRATYLDAQQKERERDFFLPNEKAVRQDILQKGGIPLSIRRKEYGWWQREYLNKQYRIKILRSVVFHMEVGMSPGKALALVIEAEPNPGKRLEFEPALEVLRQGGQFSEAIQQLRMYDRSVIAMLMAGERVGQLLQVMQTAVAHMESKRNSWKVLATAMAWLSFDIFSAISSVIGTQTYFLPWLEKNGIQSNDQSAVTHFKDSLHLAYILNGTLLWLLVAITAVLVVGGCGYMFGRGAFRDLMEKVLIRIPLIKSFLYDGAISDTFAIVGRMLEGHSQFTEAVRTAANATFIPGVRKFWEDTLQRVFEGHQVARAMHSPLLTRAEQIELEAHHNTAQLAKIMLAIAEERDDLAKQGTRRVTMAATMLTVLFSAATAGIGIWLLVVQGGGLDATLSAMSSGG